MLIYVSLAERYARIVADDGAAKVIDQSQWRAIVDGLTGQMKTGATVDALIDAATNCGDLLAQHFPARGAGLRRSRGCMLFKRRRHCEGAKRRSNPDWAAGAFVPLGSAGMR